MANKTFEYTYEEALLIRQGLYCLLASQGYFKSSKKIFSEDEKIKALDKLYTHMLKETLKEF